MATEAFIRYGIPYAAKKSVEMGRYYGSEALRNKKLQDKIGDYVVEKGKKYTKKAFSAGMVDLTTNVRPDQPYKTNRKDLGDPMPATYKKNGKVYLKGPYKGGQIGGDHGEVLDKAGTPGKVANWTTKGVETLIPSTKPVFKRHWSGDIAKSGFGRDHGIISGKFWRRPTKEEEIKMGIIPKGSNPELFFHFNKNGDKYRMYKAKFFDKNPEAIQEMGEILDNDPNDWKQMIKERYALLLMTIFGKTAQYNQKGTIN